MVFNKTQVYNLGNLQIIESLMNSMKDGVIILDIQKQIIGFNDSVSSLIGKEITIGKNIYEYFKTQPENDKTKTFDSTGKEFFTCIIPNTSIKFKLTQTIIKDEKNSPEVYLWILSENTPSSENDFETGIPDSDLIRKTDELQAENLKKTKDIESLQSLITDLEMAQENALHELEFSQMELIEQRDSLELANKELQIAESKIASIIHSMPDAVLVIDQNGIVVAWNMAMEKLTGIMAKDIIGKGDYEYSIPFYGRRKKMLIDLLFETDERLKHNYKNVIYDDEMLSTEMFTERLGKEGIYLHSTASSIRDNENNIIGGIEIFRDITARFNAEKKIEEQQKEVIAINTELRQTMEELTTQRDMLEEKTMMLAETLDQLEKSQHKLVESAKMIALGQLIAGVAHEVNTPLGAIRSSVSNITETLENVLTNLPHFFRLLDSDDKSNFYILLNRSIKAKTSITSKEERTFKRTITNILDENGIAKSDDYADTLVDMEIYDGIEEMMPFFKSTNCDEILQMAYKVSSVLRSSRTINIAIERASKVVFALKNFSHFNQTGDMVKSNIVESIETVITLYYNQIKHGVILTKRYDENIPEILCFPDELNQVWTNLVHNAIQAMQYSGTLEIDIAHKDSKVYVSITDSGSGIPEEIKEKIFVPFFTTKPQGEGSGLGLDIVKRIVEKHDGNIGFTSTPGRTTFTVSLPIIET